MDPQDVRVARDERRRRSRSFGQDLERGVDVREDQLEPGHGNAVLEQLDFELEAAIVVGKTIRDADVATADDAIFGLMVMNDLSARALQMHEMKLNLGPAKGKDFATTIGPYLVPKADLAKFTRVTPRGSQFDLPMTARHNGEWSWADRTGCP